MHSLQWCIILLEMVYNDAMRTTITMDDETAEIATQYARANGLSLSKAISELIYRATRPRSRIKYVNGWPVFDLPRSGKRITTEHVKMLEDQEL